MGAEDEFGIYFGDKWIGLFSVDGGVQWGRHQRWSWFLAGTTDWMEVSHTMTGTR